MKIAPATYKANRQIIKAKAKELGWTLPNGDVWPDKWNEVIDLLDQENPMWRGYPVEYVGQGGAL